MRTLRRPAAPSFLRVVDPNVGHVRPRPARRLIGSVRFIADVGAILCGLLTAEEAQRRMAAEGLALPLGHVELFTLFTMLACWPSAPCSGCTTPVAWPARSTS